jgi:hypothetical protein
MLKWNPGRPSRKQTLSRRNTIHTDKFIRIVVLILSGRTCAPFIVAERTCTCTHLSKQGECWCGHSQGTGRGHSGQREGRGQHISEPRRQHPGWRSRPLVPCVRRSGAWTAGPRRRRPFLPQLVEAATRSQFAVRLSSLTNSHVWRYTNLL